MTMISTWLPKVMRSGKRKNAASATSHGSASAARKRWRLSRYSAARSRACPRSTALMVSFAAIEPRRFHQEDSHRDRVNEEAAGVGEQIFARGIENAEHQRGKQRAFQASKPPDCNDNQEKHQVKHGKARRQAEQLNGKSAAERGKTGTHRKRQREQPIDIDADGFGHAPVVDCGTDLGADIGTLKGVPEHGDEQRPD